MSFRRKQYEKAERYRRRGLRVPRRLVLWEPAVPPIEQVTGSDWRAFESTREQSARDARNVKRQNA